MRLSREELERLRRWFAFVRDRRREQSAVVERLAAALECDAADVWQMIENAADDDAAFAELLKATGTVPNSPVPDAALLELLRERRYRKGKHHGR